MEYWRPTVDRGDATEVGEGRFAMQALRVVAGGDEERACGVRPHTA